MPTIKRQTMPQVTTVPVANGSVLSTAVPVTSLCEERIKVCVYGRNRSGKTTLAAQFPKPILFISCEPAHCGGVQSIGGMQGVTLIRAEPEPTRDQLAAMTPEHRTAVGSLFGRKKVEAIAKELVSTNYYKTVVLKTATSLQDVILEEMKVEFPGIPMSGRGSKDTYMMRASRLHEALHPLLDLRHVHVVILAQEKDHNPPVGDGGFPDLKAKLLQTMQQGSFMAPALGAANAQWLYDNCGYMIQIYEDETTQEMVIRQNGPDGKPLAPIVQRVGTGKRQRHLRLLYHANFAAGGKWQWNKDMPEFVTAPTPTELYAAMAKYIPALGR